MPKRFHLCAIFALLCLLALIPSSESQDRSTSPESKGHVVYVCACLKTRSCACMTESKMEGPCACGTEGGPPLKPVPSNSSWAKDNRKALSK